LLVLFGSSIFSVTSFRYMHKENKWNQVG
jgi:hypothetical protein